MVEELVDLWQGKVWPLVEGSSRVGPESSRFTSCSLRGGTSCWGKKKCIWPWPDEKQAVFFLYFSLSSTFCHTFLSQLLLHHPNPTDPGQPQHFPQFLNTSSSSDIAVNLMYPPFLANSQNVGEEWTQEAPERRWVCIFRFCWQRRTRISETRCCFATDTAGSLSPCKLVANAQIDCDQNEINPN